MDYSESETVIPSTCPSGESDNRAQTKSRSLNNTQIESATWKHQSSRINRRNPFDFGVDEDPGPSRTIQSSRRTLSQCERSSLTGNSVFTWTEQLCVYEPQQNLE